MPRGLPDYNVKESQVSQSVDYQDAIMTSMLGLNSIDGFGRLYYVDTFQRGINHWRRSINGDGSLPVTRFGSGEVGDVGCYMYGGTTLDTSFSFMQKGFRLDGGVSLGVEVGIKNSISKASFVLQVNFRSLAWNTMGAIKYDWNNRFYIWDNVLGYVLLDSFDAAPNEGEWLSIKMVLNNSTTSYDRILLGQQRYENTGYYPQHNANLGDTEIFISLYAYSGGAGKEALEVGHVFVTTDEP